MKRFLLLPLLLAVGALAPASAQSLQPNPRSMFEYAKMGALWHGGNFAKKGKFRWACTTYRHLLFIEESDNRSTASDRATTKRLISKVCR